MSFTSFSANLRRPGLLSAAWTIIPTLYDDGGYSGGTMERPGLKALLGGNLPLGYDLPASGTRTLLVNEAEAPTVRHIFKRYLELGSTHALQRELAEQGIVSKRRIFSTGRTAGGQAFSRGALFHLLRNQIYLGKIVHKDQVFEGEHDGIVDPDLFARVQARLDAQVRRHSSNAAQRGQKAPLTGKLFDATGAPMSPAASRGKSGRIYRYYVSTSLQQGFRPAKPAIVQRLSAAEIERVISEAIRRWTQRLDDPLEIVRSAHLSKRGLQLMLDTARCATLATRLADNELILDRTPDSVTILLPIIFPARRGRHLVVPAQARSPQPDRVLIAALRKAHAMLRTERGLPTIETAPTSPYERNILRLAFLAPDIQRAILEGRQPHHLNLETLKSIELPLRWSRQREVLGFRQ